MGNLQIGEQFKVKTGSSDGLSLRSDATTKDGTKNILVSIPNGAEVTLESAEVKTVDKRTWYNVKYTDKDKKQLKGWVASDYLEDLLFSLPTLSFSALWSNHPGELVDPCDKKTFQNQCAIRMGVALEKSGVDLSSFQGARCWENYKPPHDPKHILRAQELADWLKTQTKLVGRVQTYQKLKQEKISGKMGIIFFQNIPGYQGLDHIDFFDGQNLGSKMKKFWKSGEDQAKAKCPPEWWEASQQVWFWDLCPCIMTTNQAKAYKKADINSGSLGISFIPGESLEVVAIQENWVQAMVSVKEGDKWVRRVGFIDRDAVLIPGQKPGYTLYTTVGEILKDTGAVQVLERYGALKSIMFAAWAEGMDLKGLLAKLMEWGETGTLKELLAKEPAQNAGLTEDMVRKVLVEINARK